MKGHDRAENLENDNMKSPVSRRSFLKGASLAVGSLAAVHCFPAPAILRAASPGKKLNCVLIGCGGRGSAHLGATANENLVAFVEVDENRHADVQKFRAAKGSGGPKAEAFTDYRKMFDKIHKQIDAVFIATPNHQHALPAMIAMQLGKNVYVEKPLCHDVAEARKLRAMAAKCKVATQMGNQGHCEEGYRRLCEYIWAGAIGPITETHSWCDRSNGGVGPRPAAEPAPAGMHWDEWIGPAPYRDFHSDLHPHEWHGWYDFGNGSLGNLGCHVIDGVYWALKLGHPTSVEAEAITGGSDERCPTGTRIRWDLPARGEMPAMKAYWYDGYTTVEPKSTGTGKKGSKRGAHYLPPLLGELKKKYPAETFESNGTLYVGEKGILYTGCYGRGMRLVPKEKMSDLAEPPKTIHRTKGSFVDFLRACREGKTDTAASFDYGAQLTEFTLLGNLAQHAGVGKKVAWDGPNMQVTNLPELNRWLAREYRKGWQV
jgi:predicted dehydrogenase